MFCKNEVEDECHFITKCPLYSDNRHELYCEIKKTCLYFDNLSNTQKLIHVMRNEHTIIINNLAKFVHVAMRLRNKRMSQI